MLGNNGPLGPPDLRLTFAYDAFARRVSKSVVHLLADGTEVTADETHFVWDGHVVVHEVACGVSESEGIDADALTTWYWDPGSFTPIAKEKGGKRYSIASDHLGTPTEMYDEAGALAWRMQLDVFGVAEFEVGEAEDCPWRWPGQYEDGESGDYYNRWRYYDARSGTYVSKDPSRLRGGNALYGYCAEPLFAFDPFGLEDIVWRAVRPEDIRSMDAGLGILPKDPSSTNSIETHIMRGSDPAYRGDNYISMTRNESFARRWARRSGMEFVAIDLDLVPRATDLTDFDEAMRHLDYDNEAWRRASGAAEVLSVGAIPQDAVVRRGCS